MVRRHPIPSRAAAAALVTWTWSVDGGSPIVTTGPTVLSTGLRRPVDTRHAHDRPGRDRRQRQPEYAGDAPDPGDIGCGLDPARRRHGPRQRDHDHPGRPAGPWRHAARWLAGDGAPASKSFTGLPAGSYVMVQAPASGLALVRITCTDPDGGSTVSVTTRTATIDLDSGESIACTFTSVVTTNVADRGRRPPIARVHAGPGDADPEGDRVHGHAGRPRPDDGLRRVDHGGHRALEPPPTRHRRS